MIKTLIIIALVTLASLNKANDDWSLSYKGKLRTPLDLYTQEGSRLEKGNYNIEVECRQKCSLQLFQGDQVVANLEGTLSRGYQKRNTALMIPIVGTIFLQSSIKTTGPVVIDRLNSSCCLRSLEFQNPQRKTHFNLNNLLLWT